MIEILIPFGRTKGCSNNGKNYLFKNHKKLLNLHKIRIKKETFRYSQNWFLLDWDNVVKKDLKGKSTHVWKICKIELTVPYTLVLNPISKLCD